MSELSPDHGLPDVEERAGFMTTLWSVVREAGAQNSPLATESLQRLCRSYWYPLYVYVRSKGHGPEEAKDLTQQFFARFLERRYITLADKSKGRFRNLLLHSMNHFLINEWRKTQAEKRGGGLEIVSWQLAEMEQRYGAEKWDGESPDRIFDKKWANRLLELVMERLRQEYSEPHKRELFDALEDLVLGDSTDTSTEEIAERFEIERGAVHVAVHRLRRRFRELLRAEVECTVETESEVDEELRYLATVLRS